MFLREGAGRFKDFIGNLLVILHHFGQRRRGALWNRDVRPAARYLRLCPVYIILGEQFNATSLGIGKTVAKELNCEQPVGTIWYLGTIWEVPLGTGAD